jgi:hypothetical protein
MRSSLPQRVGAANGKKRQGWDSSGNDVGNAQIFKHGYFIFQPQLPLLEAGELKLVRRGHASQGIDSDVEISVLHAQGRESRGWILNG